MHEDYEDEDYDDEYDYDHPSLNPPYKWFFKFDVGPDTPLSKWINDMVNNFMESGEMINIPGFPPKMFPVNSWTPDTGKGNSFQYLGSNYQGSPIWKKQYFVVDKMNNEYTLHLQSHAQHFIKQPTYYKGLFDILN